MDEVNCLQQFSLGAKQTCPEGGWRFPDALTGGVCVRALHQHVLDALLGSTRAVWGVSFTNKVEPLGCGETVESQGRYKGLLVAEEIMGRVLCCPVVNQVVVQRSCEASGPGYVPLLVDVLPHYALKVCLLDLVLGLIWKSSCGLG